MLACREGEPAAFKGSVAVADQKPEKSSDERVSPYLRLPLRSFEQADKDRKSRPRETADAEEKATCPI